MTGSRGTDRGAVVRSTKTHVASFTDPEAYALATVLATGASAPRFVGAVDDTFRAKISRASLERLDVGTGHASLPVTFSGGIPNAHVFLFATELAAARRISGWSVDSQHIFHPRPNDEAFATSSAGQPWPYANIVVPFDFMATKGLQVTGLSPNVPLNDDRLFQAPYSAMGRLVGLMKDVTHIAETMPWIITTPWPAKALAGAITDALLTCLMHGRTVRDRVGLRRRRQIIMRFEEAMRERPTEMLSMPDICATLGVARRTLNLACLEFLGQGATQYARSRRLDHVRQTLLASDSPVTQVTAVAIDFGFWELGRFSQAYRSRFGERPSETLRRARTGIASVSKHYAIRAQIA